MAATNSAAAAAQGKSKKVLVLGIVAALLLVVTAAAVLLMFKRTQGNPYDEEVPARNAVVVPTFLPLENMVVNLADPGGDRYAQIGITLELQDEATATTVKQYMPSIRNGILMLVSQRTAGELLQREGKELLAADILREVTRPMGWDKKQAEQEDSGYGEYPRRRANPVRRVLFSSFIIQ